MDEAQLVRRLRAGDQEALLQLFGRYRVRIYKLCLRYAGNPSDALDLAQEAFLRMFQKAGSLRDEQSFARWFFRLTANLANDFLRARGKLVLEADKPELTERNTESAGLPDPLDQAALLEEHELVQRAVERLPEGCRQVFLNCVMGFTHKEIAATLGISEESSRAQYHKARKRLLRELAELSSQNLWNPR